MRLSRQGAPEPTFPEAPSFREGAMADPKRAGGAWAHLLLGDGRLRPSFPRKPEAPEARRSGAGIQAAFAGATRPARGFPENGVPGLRIGRAGDADPGSLLRRRRRDSALPEVSIPPGLVALLGARPTPVLRNPYAGRARHGLQHFAGTAVLRPRSLPEALPRALRLNLDGGRGA